MNRAFPVKEGILFKELEIPLMAFKRVAACFCRLLSVSLFIAQDRITSWKRYNSLPNRRVFVLQSRID
jgi:hypothetical protein